jgi:hypothetical protein
MKGVCMKYYAISLFLLGSIWAQKSHSQVLEIDCAVNDCSYDNDLNVINIGGEAEFTAFEIFPNDKDIKIFTPTGQDTRNVRTNILNQSAAGQSLEVDLRSTTSTTGAGSLVLIGDRFSTLDIKLDGANGVSGKDATVLCAENYKSGVYGADSKTNFDQRRIDDTGLNNDNCDITDVNYLKDNKYVCPAGLTEVFSPDVDVERIKQKRRCSGASQRSRCVRRTLDIACNLELVGTPAPICCNDTSAYTVASNTRYPLLDGWTCDPSDCGAFDLSGVERSGLKREFTLRKAEKEILNGVTKDLCLDYITNVAVAPEIIFVDNDTNEVTSLAVSRSGTTSFTFPVPTIKNVGGGGIEWVIEDMSGANFATCRGCSTSAQYAMSSCVGLSGSSDSDFNCSIPNSPSFSFKIRAMDVNGLISNQLTVTVAEGTRTFEKTIEVVFEVCSPTATRYFVRYPDRAEVSFITPSGVLGCSSSLPNFLNSAQLEAADIIRLDGVPLLGSTLPNGGCIQPPPEARLTRNHPGVSSTASCTVGGERVVSDLGACELDITKITKCEEFWE